MRFPSSHAMAHYAAQAVLCLLAFNVHAATPDASPAGTRLTLQATASSEIPLDTVRITLAAETQSADQTTASQQLAAALDAAAKQAQGAAGIVSHTGNYGVWPNHDNQGKINNWHGRGEIVLESKDFAAASALATRMSDKVAISNIAFILSHEARAAEEHQLLGQVAQAFQARALDAAKAFGFSSYRMVELDLGGAGAAPPMPHPAAMMRMAKTADAIDAPLEGGSVVVSVSVNGTIALQ
ncbi:MAG TPA: SIMPL domain-containing protein [Bordetella sp.]